MPLELKLNNQNVKIDTGELVSYKIDDYECIHQKGTPGWRSSDTEMFPIIGPTNEANFTVKTPLGNATQDQHGLLRELNYNLINQSQTEATFSKIYKKNTAVKNSKYPEKSSAEFLSWPYDFQFIKQFQLNEDSLTITFKVSGDTNMPFMLGYHPAFKLHTANPVIKTADKTISLKEVMDVGSRALSVPGCDKITLIDDREITIETSGFNNFMLWTEVPNMLCIEPITFYPYDVKQENLNKGFHHLDKKEKEFIVSIYSPTFKKHS
ncbi:MAG: aldose 1-epimerase [Leeuwenhoekiella sp.]